MFQDFSIFFKLFSRFSRDSHVCLLFFGWGGGTGGRGRSQMKHLAYQTLQSQLCPMKTITKTNDNYDMDLLRVIYIVYHPLFYSMRILFIHFGLLCQADIWLQRFWAFTFLFWNSFILSSRVAVLLVPCQRRPVQLQGMSCVSAILNIVCRPDAYDRLHIQVRESSTARVAISYEGI